MLLNGVNKFLSTKRWQFHSASVSCSPSVSPAISTSALMALINSTGNQVNALENMIDGGNTKKLLNDIASITNNGQLRKELMDYSPYLSDSVLLEYLRRNKTPAGNIKDVIIANSPVKPFVNEVIDSLTLPLGILVQIHLAQHGIAPIDTLQSRIASLNSNISLITDNQVRELLSDTADAWANDSLLILLSHDKRQESSDMLLASFVNFRMYAQADSLANQLKLNGEQNTFAEVQQIANQLNQTQEQAFSLLSNKSQQAQISEISKQYTQQGYINAKALLNLVVENYAQHTEWVTFPNKNSRRAIKKIVAKRDSLQASSLKVYPNPFGESLITVVYQLPSKAVRANLAITDITGRLLQSLELPTSATTTHIDLGKLPAGIYIAILNADGNIVGRTKLIKQ